MSFKEDLKRGQSIENELIKLLLEEGEIVFTNASPFLKDLKKYDLSISSSPYPCDMDITLEVKADFKAATTGNVCVERQAMSHTEADMIVYFIEGTYYFYASSSIKRMIDNKEYKRETSGGDQGYNNILYLFDKEYFISKSIKQLTNK